jgi:REP-associated tyrosine transposase
MRYNPEKHHRRSIRLKDYDYSLEGTYFISICTQERMCLFGDIVDDAMVLSDAGKMVEKTFLELPEKYPGNDVDGFVVMPNHIHGIIVIETRSVDIIETNSSVGAAPCGRPLTASDEIETRTVNAIQTRDEGQPQGVAPTDGTRMTLSDFVHRFKSYTTHLYSHGVKRQGWFPFPGRLWQRNFYERVIRNEEELNNKRDYILNNPTKWSDDEENPENPMMSSQQENAADSKTQR